MKKILKIAGISLMSILVLLIVTPLLFKSKIADEVQKAANRSLNSEVKFGNISLTFFRHFPNLTLTLSDFIMMGSPPFEDDTLINAGEVGFGVNLRSLFSDRIRINKVYLSHASVQLLYNENGIKNFDVYHSSKVPAGSDTDTTSGPEIHIEDIYFMDCRFTYSDASVPFAIVAEGLNYSGKSVISGSVFDITSKVKIDSLNVTVDQMALISQKPVTAKMNTRINSEDMTIFFEKNDLKIRDIPIQFNGKINFEPDGYQLGLTFLSLMEKEFLSARLKLIQGKNLYVAAKTTASIDIGRWSRALGLESAEVKGMFDLSLSADGYYRTGPVKRGLRGETDTVIISIPKFQLMTTLSGGYLKFRELPHSLSDVSFSLDASCPDQQYRNIRLDLKNLKATFLDNIAEGYFSVKNLSDFPVDGRLMARCDLHRIREVIPMDSLEMAGALDINVEVKGNYNPDKKQFPVTAARISWKDGKVLTPWYPNPVEKIEMVMEVTNRTGNLNDLVLKLLPVTFRFEGQPFLVATNLQNFDNMSYEIRSKGVVDLGRLYRVFARKGYGLDGYIETDFSLKGTLKDAMEGNVDKLTNKGLLKLRNITLRSDYYPKPFQIRTGDFRFDQDKIWFDNFVAGYGNSGFRLKGAITNSIAWFLSKGRVLRGKFDLLSDFIDADEFMVFAPTGDTPPASSQAPAGVIIIPRDLDIDFNASVKRVAFSGLDIRNLKGEIDLKEGILLLDNAGFDLIGCRIGMSAAYGDLNPERAHFDFKIKAENFDIKRAYNELDMIREMVPSAGKAEGIVSLDYSLKGLLNNDMYPILPSLEGSGTVFLNHIKVFGLKLFNDISRKTQRDGLANPDMKKVEIRSVIRNNTVTVEQFKFRVSPFRLRIEGSSTFDNLMDLRIRLGLPPLGIFGIPLKVSGPADDLKIRFGRGKDSEEAEESDYSDELPAELLERIKNAKEEGGEEQPPLS